MMEHDANGKACEGYKESGDHRMIEVHLQLRHCREQQRGNKHVDEIKTTGTVAQKGQIADQDRKPSAAFEKANSPDQTNRRNT